MAVVEPTPAELDLVFALNDVIEWENIGGDPTVASSKSGSLLVLLGCDAGADIQEIASIDAEDLKCGLTMTNENGLKEWVDLVRPNK